MGRLLVLLLMAVGAVEAPADAPEAGAPEAKSPDGLLVMGVVGRDGSASAVHGERAVVADPRTGEVRARRLAGGTLCYSEVMAVGDRVLYHGHRGRRGVLLSLPLSLSGAPRVLSDSRRGRDGRVLPELPAGAMLPRWTAVHGVVAGRLLIQSGRRLMLWDLGLGRPVRTIRDGWPLAVGRTRFAWCGSRCRVLRVRSDSGERRFLPPPGTRLYTGNGALSPDGSRLALPVTDGGGQRAAVLDLASGSWTMVPGGELRGYEAMAWSPSGRWLYFTSRHLNAWRLGSPDAVRLPIDTDGTVMSIATAG
jgi:hypothetical protein